MGRLQLELANHVNGGAQLQAADDSEVQGFMAVQADVHLRFHRPATPLHLAFIWLSSRCFHIDRLDFPSALGESSKGSLTKRLSDMWQGPLGRAWYSHANIYIYMSASTIADQVTEPHQHMHYRHAIVSA